MSRDAPSLRSESTKSKWICPIVLLSADADLGRQVQPLWAFLAQSLSSEILPLSLTTTQQKINSCPEHKTFLVDTLLLVKTSLTDEKRSILLRITLRCWKFVPNELLLLVVQLVLTQFRRTKSKNIFCLSFYLSRKGFKPTFLVVGYFANVWPSLMHLCSTE